MHLMCFLLQISALCPGEETESESQSDTALWVPGMLQGIIVLVPAYVTVMHISFNTNQTHTVYRQGSTHVGGVISFLSH
jgi:hypothetical protein